MGTEDYVGEVVKVDSIIKYLEEIDKFIKTQKNDRFIYRGQANAEWDIVPGATRRISISEYPKCRKNKG